MLLRCPKHFSSQYPQRLSTEPFPILSLLSPSHSLALALLPYTPVFYVLHCSFWVLFLHFVPCSTTISSHTVSSITFASTAGCVCSEQEQMLLHLLLSDLSSISLQPQPGFSHINRRLARLAMTGAFPLQRASWYPGVSHPWSRQCGCWIQQCDLLLFSRESWGCHDNCVPAEPEQGCSIHTPPRLMHFILPAGRGWGCKHACGEMLEAALQHGEKLRPFWVAPFPKDNYFLGASEAEGRGLIYIKAFCTLSPGLNWAGSRSARYRSGGACRNAANYSSFSSTPGCLWASQTQLRACGTAANVASVSWASACRLLV